MEEKKLKKKKKHAKEIKIHAHHQSTAKATAAAAKKQSRRIEKERKGTKAKTEKERKNTVKDTDKYYTQFVCYQRCVSISMVQMNGVLQHQIIKYSLHNNNNIRNKKKII